jgi:hypothetical protein
MAEIWYLVTSVISLPHIMGSVFGPIRFLLPVCWLLIFIHIEHICTFFKINKIGKQEVEIWWVQKRFPWYGVPIWSLWPNIRFLPSIVDEKNVTKNVHKCFLSNYWWQRSDIWSQFSYRYPISWEAFLDPSDSYFLFAHFVDFYTHWTYILYIQIHSICYCKIAYFTRKDTKAVIRSCKSKKDWPHNSYKNKMNCELILTYDTPALRQSILQ